MKLSLINGERTYRPGDVFDIAGRLYMLVPDSPRCYMLFDLVDGIKWENQVFQVRDTEHVEPVSLPCGARYAGRFHASK